MGLWDKIRGEFVDIIEWLVPSSDTMVRRFERHGNEIKYGAQLVVRESQVAVLINEGQLADVFTPGTYTLETENIPILSTLKGWKHGFESPFKAEVYFVNTR
jgi:membrane protease subunit (stomatin/prohibitin family)